MSEQDIDQLLVERAQRGDKQAFNVLVQRYQYKVQSLIARYVKNPADVADVAQDAFIKAYRALASFRGESAFFTWLYRIAVNSAKNYLMAQGRKPGGADIAAEDAEFLEGGEALHDVASPENELLSDEIRRVVFDTIESLPEELRLAITLREMDGLSYEEIATVMDCPVGTVRSRIFRAREAIDKELAPLMAR